MSCNACQSKFTIFRRENGCPNCGFSYCGKCLKYPCTLPDGSSKKVCRPCYNKLTMSTNNSSANSSELPSPVSNAQSLAPVDIANKLEALENPAKPPIVIYKPGGHWENLKSGLDPEDQVIVDRLKKLKDNDKDIPAATTEEIRRRLAILKDQDPDANQQSINIHQVDSRTDQEKTDDLIRQYAERMSLSSGSDAAMDVEQRLNSLKGLDPQKEYSSRPEMDDDEATVTKRMIEKALAEAALEAKYGVDEPEELEMEHEDEDAKSVDSDESKSCCMCEESHRLFRCSACHDLYCEKCFLESHDEDELRFHKMV